MALSDKKFKFRVTQQEIQVHFTNRSNYHAKRASDKEAVLPDLRKAAEEINEGRTMQNTKTRYGADINSEIQDLENDILNHKKASAKFDWLTAHVMEGEQEIDIDELNRFEFF